MNERKETKSIIIHCSATPADRDIGRKEIDRWHRERGFLMVGYHYVIRRDGEVEVGRPREAIGAHAYGHNATSVGICLAGGMDEHMKKPECNFNSEQLDALHVLLEQLREVYGDDTVIIGHNEVSNKACPSFNVQDWIRPLGFNMESIA